MSEPPYRPWILSLADDLTGALEVGAKFAARGLKATVTTKLKIAARPLCDILVIDTETRHLSEEQASCRIQEIVRLGSLFQPFLIYKKTDSTLRGNIGAELSALQKAIPGRSLLYAPAYSAMGRTVRQGHLYVDGKLLHETEFAGDLLNPARHSNIRALLKNETITVLDGESHTASEETVRLIMQTEPKPLTAGPAALAEALACHLHPQKNDLSLPVLSRCLVVNGSLHPASQSQIRFAQENQCFSQEWLYFGQSFSEEGLGRAKQLGVAVRDSLSTSRFDGLVIFGGDTAFGIHQALGSLDFEPLGEVLPGVPIVRCAGLLWITKAGGFGQPDLLHTLKQALAKSE